MKNSKSLKRLLSFALCICMVLSLLPNLSAHASTATQGSGIVGTYDKDRGNLRDDTSGNPDAVAEVSKNGVSIGTYTDLNDAILAVSSATKEDEAVVTLLKDIYLEDGQQSIESGVFTLNLNGCELGSLESVDAGLMVMDSEITIIDPTGLGKLLGLYYGVIASNSTLNISDGTFIGSNHGVNANKCTVNVTGGTLRGDGAGLYMAGGSVNITDGTFATSGNAGSTSAFALYVNGCSEGTISGGTFSGIGSESCAIFTYDTTVTISGGSIEGEEVDMIAYSPVALTAGEDGVGATFSDGITIRGSTLNDNLGEGMSYWAGDVMQIVEDGAAEITGKGEITIKPTCYHTENKNADDNDCTTAWYCSECTALIEGAQPVHSFDENGVCANCEVSTSDAIIIRMADSAADSWNGNALEVYENGELIATVTIDEYVANGAWNISYDAEKLYTFKWVVGSWSSECSFEILISNESVFTASGEDCREFTNGQALFTTCDHVGNTNEDDGDCTTALECSLCGGNAVQARLSHTPGDDVTYDELTHSFTCAVCGTAVAGEHNIQDGLCSCGMLAKDIVVTATVKGITKGYTNLTEAFRAVQYTTAEDEVVLKLVKDIDLGDNEVTVYGGVFTLDLNDCTITSSSYTSTIYVYMYSGGELTVVDDGAQGIGAIRSTESSWHRAFFVTEGIVNLESGIYSAAYVSDKNAVLNISGEAEINGADYAVSVHGGSVYIKGGTLCNTSTVPWYGAIYVNGGQTTITGGEINGATSDIAFGAADAGVVTLALEDGNTTGATFPDGITLYSTTLNDILGEGLAYWQGNKQIYCTDDATEIIDGDVVIKAACTHENATLSYEPNGEDHLTIYSCCGYSCAEDHSYDDGVVKEPNCTEQGGTVYTCSACGHSFIEDTVAALGHSFGDDNICDICGFDLANALVINMYDDYGDGWSGNAIQIFVEGELVTTVTIEEGSEGTYSMEYDPEKLYALYWLLGDYSYECSYEVIVCGEEVSSGSDPSSDELIYTNCTHSYESTVTAPNCTESGFTTYTCSICGHSYEDDLVDALGHTPNDEGVVTAPTCTTEGYTHYICTTCGEDYVSDEMLPLGHDFDENNLCTACGVKAEITISMRDGYGDGWNGNSILIYENGELIAEAAVSEIEDSLTFDYSLSNSYRFEWKKGDYSNECRFTISLSGLMLYEIFDCNEFEDGESFYVICEHSWLDATCTAPQTCERCGLTMGFSLGHTPDEDDICIVCGAECSMRVYFINQPSWDEVYLYYWRDDDSQDITWPGLQMEFYLHNGEYDIYSLEIPSDIAGLVINNGQGEQTVDFTDCYDGVCYTLDEIFDLDQIVELGWVQIDGEWYYFDTGNGKKTTGLSRVPYPTEAINGITYAPDQDAIDYYESKGEAFIDETEGWFCFNEDGIFQSEFTNIIKTSAKNIYLEDGFAAWNPGLVELEDGYYYFVGDVENGGNKNASGNYYVGKNNTDLDITISGLYTFDETGKLREYDGIADIDGVYWYYEDSQIMLGKGLIIIDGYYYYVRSDGTLVCNQTYWVANTNNLKFTVGAYEFDAFGRIILPEKTEKHGIYFERGAWYYYENGMKGYSKGLIFTDLHWYDADGIDIWAEGGIIYVRSDGRLANGRYYISNIDNYDGALDVKVGMALNFDEMGMYISPKNGIYEVDGVLRYFINDVMQYNSGVIVVDDNYYYVRSNGEVVRDCTYWITNVGSSGVIAGYYAFDEDGVMQNPEFEGEAVLNGIANGYYYENGEIAFNKGLIYLETEGCYIYVRSNGKIATGKYWITNHNDLLTAGLYDFGTDGKLYR